MNVPASPRSIVVAGAGLAATQVTTALREEGFDGRLTVLGSEGVAPYDRPPLSKHLLDRVEPAWLTTELGVDLSALADEVRLDEPALGLTLGASGVRVATARGEVVADALIVATGAHAVRPWTAALTLHTAADAQVLRGALRAGDRLVIVGAGWIGAEVAGIAAAAGVDVTVVEAARTPLAGPLGAAVGALTAPWYEAAGVRLVVGARVAEVGDRVLLDDGTSLPADVVLAAVGARPTTAWLAGALPLTAGGSLLVDEAYAVLGEPPHPRRWVRAVGDVATRRSARHGWVPGGHWDGALRGPGELAADLVRPGARAVADHAPYVFSTQFGRELTLFGQPSDADEVVLRGDPAGPWTALWYRPGTDTVSAVLTVDRPRDVGAARRLFAAPHLPILPRSTATNPSAPLRP